MLTVTQCADYLIRRLDGEPSVPVITLCNQAGSYLADMHNWSWLVRPAAKLNLVEGLEYIALPSDFGKIYGQPKPTTISSVVSLQLVSMEEYLRYRQDYFDGGPLYMATTVYAKDPDNVYGPKLQIWPVPTESKQDAFRLPYLAKWTDVTNDTEALALPPWVEYFYLVILFAFAQGYDEHDVAPLSQRLAILQQSPEFMNLKKRDGGSQPFIGRIRGGAMESEYISEGGVKIGLAGRLLDPYGN